jgi:hypothetical protein
VDCTHRHGARTFLCQGWGGLESGGFRLQHRICWLDFTFSWIIIDVVGDSSSSLKGFKLGGPSASITTEILLFCEISNFPLALEVGARAKETLLACCRLISLGTGAHWGSCFPCCGGVRLRAAMRESDAAAEEPRRAHVVGFFMVKAMTSTI